MIFDGRAYAKEIEEQVKELVASMSVKPKIVSILIGDDPASELYTNLKQKAAERVGIRFEIVNLPQDNAEALKQKVAVIAEQNGVSGVMVQMPVPGLTRDEQERLLSAIPFNKDVDGLRWTDSGKVPATVRAILSILDKIAMVNGQWSIDNFWNMKFVVVGTHGSVGRPLVHFLKLHGAKDIVEINSKTSNPGEFSLRGDIIISCVGKPGLVTAEMVKDDALVVDVGINKVDGKVVGDMFPEVYQKASFAVPVPGGVGPVTIACLMLNSAELKSISPES